MAHVGLITSDQHVLSYINFLLLLSVLDAGSISGYQHTCHAAHAWPFSCVMHVLPCNSPVAIFYVLQHAMNVSHSLHLGSSDTSAKYQSSDQICRVC